MSSRSVNRVVLLISIFIAMSSFTGCDDPVPGSIGGLVLLIQSTEALRDAKVANISSIEIKTLRIEAVCSDSLSSTQRMVTLDTQEREIIIVNSGIQNRLVGQYQVPTGFVWQIRIFPKKVLLHMKDGSSIPLDETRNIPSWFQSGWKIIPADNSTWPITKDELTGVRAVFSFDDQIHNNKGIGYQIKPTVPAVQFSVNPPLGGPGLFLDQLTVVFNDTTSRQQVDSINSQIGAWVLRAPILSQAYRIKLPASINIQDAFTFYRNLQEVVSVLPAVNFGLPDIVPPGEGVQSDQIDTKLPEAWMTVNSRTGKVGDWRVRIADIDDKMDVSRIDLIPNMFINQGEIPSRVRMKLVDTDGDGIITFYDLNHALNFTPTNRSSILKDQNGNGCFDGYDLLTNADWVNMIDDDRDDLNPSMGRTIVDDIIGYNFTADSPIVYSNATITNDRQKDTHGTHVAHALASAANNANGRFSDCPYWGGAAPGVNIDKVGAVWNVSVAPLVVATSISGTDDSVVFVPDVALMDALRYVENKKMINPLTGRSERAFDIANVEMQYQIVQELKMPGDLYCSDESQYTKNVTRYDVPVDVFSDGITQQRQLFEKLPWKSMGAIKSEVLYVWPSGNSALRLSNFSIINHVSEMMRESLIDNFIMVGYAEDSNISGWRSNYGEGVVDLFTIAGSTSLAAPIVSGVAALIISQDPCIGNPAMPCSLRNNPAEVKRRIVNRAPRKIDVQTVPSGVSPGQCVNLEKNLQPLLDAHVAVQ